MVGSNSETPTRPRASDHNDVVFSFENLGLGENETTPSRPSYSWNISSAQNQRQGIGSDEQCQWRSGEPSLITRVSDKPEFSSRIFNPQDNIWAYDYCDYGRGSLISDLHSGPGSCIGSMDHRNNFLDNNTANFSGTLNGRKVSMNSCYESPSTSNSVNLLRGQSFLNDPANGYRLGFGNTDDYRMDMYSENQFPYDQNHQFMGITSNEFYLGKRYNLYDGDRAYTSGSLKQHMSQYDGQRSVISSRGLDIVTMAMTKNGSQLLQSFLQGGIYETNIILEGVLPWIFEVMKDHNGRHVFHKLLDVCNSRQLESLFMKLMSQSELFLEVAVNSHGSHSVQKLIQKLKKTPLAYSLTHCLSTKICELMMHSQGLHVIRQCLYKLGDQPNQVLYDGIIKHFLKIATDKYGCLSFNQCIDCISGEPRERLLNRIADESDYLSNDPLGNHVVQHVLSLDNLEISEKICDRLRGKYVELSLKKGGSHIVEKCIKSSLKGLVYVVHEILNTKNAPSKLARHMFGNYVIQTAIKTSKKNHPVLYENLVNVLRPYLHRLANPNGGEQKIIALISDGVPRSRAKFNPVTSQL
ncbi:unnamed protein product [Ilex paraguariensis]|uniref:PUM-HD domain-containing protein n=1 Tax=Ilex paraguariensis TaxID=185542 RepID=A0ABC8UMZ6_9AQUA